MYGVPLRKAGTALRFSFIEDFEMPRKRKIITPSKKKEVRAEDIEREIFNVDLSEESDHFSTDTESSLEYDSDKDPEYVPDADRPSKIPKLDKTGPSTVRDAATDRKANCRIFVRFILDILCINIILTVFIQSNNSIQ
ncbi:uncharacterized protein LOC113471779 [Diaphorina citri]|uniref:Uncharacterized protein LOC113471779 n=1 Tax=Diaphorina citri TaxID=121845 RepID=A0A3Q0JIN9_DIACI|nr:uncharacterized protein LOC113471779 [Diaphorina citri]